MVYFLIIDLVCTYRVYYVDMHMYSHLSVLHLSYTDPTAGGCTSEVPRWQIDELAVISQLRKGLQNLNFSKDSFTGIQDFKFFAAFLQNHDENITIAFKWLLEIIDTRKKLEITHCGEDQYGHLYPRESYSWKLRYYSYSS